MKLRYSFLFFVLLTFSCSEKDTRICYACTTTYLVVTDQPVPNYPAQTSIDNNICDVTETQAADFQTTNTGRDVAVIAGVTYTSTYSTRCVLQ